MTLSSWLLSQISTSPLSFRWCTSQSTQQDSPAAGGWAIDDQGIASQFYPLAMRMRSSPTVPTPISVTNFRIIRMTMVSFISFPNSWSLRADFSHPTLGVYFRKHLEGDDGSRATVAKLWLQPFPWAWQSGSPTWLKLSRTQEATTSKESSGHPCGPAWGHCYLCPLPTVEHKWADSWETRH